MSAPQAAASRSLVRTYLAFLGPMVVSNFLQSMSGTLNGIYIGQMLGTQAFAAVAGMFPIVFFFVSLVIGLGAGASVLIGQAWGAREPHKVKAIAGTALALGGLIGLSAAVLGTYFAHDALQALGTPSDVLEDAVRYARMLMLTMPLLLTFVVYTQLLRGVGDTVTPLFALLLSTSSGLLLTPAFIRGWMGLPQLGIASPAVAGLIANLVALGFIAVRLRRRQHVLAPGPELLGALRLDVRILKTVLRIGLPTGLQMVVVSLSELAILALVNPYGSQATAAYAAVNQIVSYVQFPALSIAIAASILGAQSIGAGRVDRLAPILRTGLALNVLITGVLIALGYLLAPSLLGMFIVQPSVLAVAQHLLHIMLWSMLLFGFQAVVGGVMRASGVVLVPVSISIVSIMCIEVPAAYLLSQHFGLAGVWMAYPVAFAAMLALQSAYYLMVWRHRKIERLI